MTLEGNFYESGNSYRRLAILNLDGIFFDLLVDDESIQSGVLSNLSFSDRIANIPRKIIFIDGSVFETQDNNKVDKIAFNSDKKNSFSMRLQIIESKWKWVLTSILFLALLGYLIIRVVLPWAGKELALIVPNKVNETISSGGLRLLDQEWFKPSELSDDKKNKISDSFSELVNTLPKSEFEYKLYFRKMGQANAFALPAGQIILTDELVRVAENPEQIRAIILHEIGHVHHRHSMQQIIRSSLISVAISMLTSDLSTLEDLVVVLPVFVLKSGFSQGDEIQADEYMFRHMFKLQMDPIHFVNILKIMTQNNLNIDDNILKYFSSHPSTKDRVKEAIRKSDKFLSES